MRELKLTNVVIRDEEKRTVCTRKKKGRKNKEK